MGRRKLCIYRIIGCLLVSACGMYGCGNSGNSGNSGNEVQEEMEDGSELSGEMIDAEMEPEDEDTADNETAAEDMVEAETEDEEAVDIGAGADAADAADAEAEEGNTEPVFYCGTEEYFYLLEGDWAAVEYAGMIRDYHFEEAWEEEYQRKQQERTDEIIEKYLGSEYCIKTDNLESFAPYSDFTIIMEDGEYLFFVTRFIPGEFIEMTPPYIGLSARLIDKDEEYRFIIDADGTVLIEIQYRFFRLEKKEEMLGGDC